MSLSQEEQVTAFEDFFRDAMTTELRALQAGFPEQRSLTIDARRLARFNPDLADQLLESPDAVVLSAEKAVEALNLETAHGKLKVHCRFHALPESSNTMVRDLGAPQLEKLISVEGVISLVTEIKPVVKLAKWKCLHCSETTTNAPEKFVISPPRQCQYCQRSDFFHLENEDVLTNLQRAQMQDLVERLKGNAATSHIEMWLEDDLVNRITAGDKFTITGTLRKRAIKQGNKQTVVYDKLLQVNYLERIEKEFEALELSGEEREEMVKLSKRPDLFDVITKSIAPSLYGYNEMKLAIALQLFSGTQNKVLPDGKRIRGEIHVLLIGDPGCLIGDERVVLGNGAIVKLEQLGKTHLQDINQPILTGQGYTRATATCFHSYKQQPILEILTQSGKSIRGTYNHPLLIVKNMKREWKRLDEIRPGDKVAVVPWIPCTIKSPVKTGFKHYQNRLGPKSRAKLPNVLGPELAGLFGYINGDGWVRQHSVSMVVNPQEEDLIPKLTATIEAEFGLKPSIILKHPKNRNPITIIELHSTDVASSLQFLRVKRVPDLVLRSGNKVAAEYLSWLFEADGCVFSKGRGKHAIQLRQSEVELLRDVQILLLRFGIHSGINERNLRIARAQSIRKFAEHIGFQSKKKKTKLLELVEARKNLHHEVGKQLSERVVQVRAAGVADVYDIEVPNGHRFIANGIISHNSGKSAMLQYVKNLAPKCIYVAGKGSSSVGLTASAEKDEFGEGWVIKAGAMVLASGGQMNLDEMDKMDDNDRSAMHEALEQGTISVAKAGIVTTFNARTSLLAAANPKLGRFNPNEPPASQFDLSPTLISRFDLIFPIKDVLDEVHDKKIAEHILKGHKFAGNKDSEAVKDIMPVIPTETLRKYIAYARQNMAPSLSQGAAEKIEDFYLRLRREGQKQNYYPVTARQIEGLIRLSEASAKARLSQRVEVEDAERAIKLTQYVLDTVFLDRETGRIDSDIINIGQAKSKTDKARTLLDIIAQKEKEVDMVSVAEIVAEAATFGIDEATTHKLLDDLYKTTEIYRPKSGHVKTSKGKRI